MWFSGQFLDRPEGQVALKEKSGFHGHVFALSGRAVVSGCSHARLRLSINVLLFDPQEATPQLPAEESGPGGRCGSPQQREKEADAGFAGT